jgi:carotenoid cleavage dioxygenase-like enzyme
MLQAGATVAASLRWRPDLGARLTLVDRESGGLAASIPIGQGYCLHQVNAFDDGEELVVDLLELEEPVYPDYDGLPQIFLRVRPARVVRLRVDPANARIVERREVDAGLAADFPVLDPRLSGAPCDTFWMLAISDTGREGRKFFDRLQRYDWRAGGVADEYATRPPRYLAGEPAFVPETPGGERGVVLVHELDVAERRSHFVVLDAFDLAAGPLARITLPSPVQLGFHALFRGDREAASADARPADERARA